MTWTVKWQLKPLPELDFVMPWQGCGQEQFYTEEEAKGFVAKLRREGIKLSSAAGLKILGNELEIQIKR